MTGRELFSITQVHGVTGLDTAGHTEIRLGARAGVVDLGLAHLGGNVTITAYAGTKKTGEGMVDAIARQFQNIRLIARSIDRIVITTDGADDPPILGYIRWQPKDRNPGKSRK